jgi:RNA polymerase-associated protein
MVLAEKGIAVDIRDVDLDDPPEDLADLNPYNSVPTLVDRELVLYDSHVIMEYLDERFPHPPLLPVDPVNRARFRLALVRVEADWYSLLMRLEQGRGGDAGRSTRKALRESLTASIAVFRAKPFFLSDEFSLVDCSLAPLLWRLAYYGIELPREAGVIIAYGEKVFDRPSFRQSLSPAERAMRR